MSDAFTSPTETDDGVRRDRWGRYLLPDPADVDGKAIPWSRVTTVAKTLSDTKALTEWQMRAVLVGVGMRPDFAERASRLTLASEDRNEGNRLAEQAKEVSGANNRAAKGTSLHSLTEAVDRGESPDMSPEDARDVAAYRKCLEVNGIEILPDLMERIVVSQTHRIAGTFDRVVRHEGVLKVLDLKTGNDVATYGMGEIAIQLAAYAYADKLWCPEEDTYRPMPPVSREHGIVIHVPAGSGQATPYLNVSLRAGYEALERSTWVREWRKTARSGTLATAGETITIPREIRPEIKERLDAAASRDEFVRIMKDAQRQGMWDDETETYAIAKWQAVRPDDA